ncbi:MAG: hypothetical protein AB1726_06420 [Planctomycetota bacterium]
MTETGAHWSLSRLPLLAAAGALATVPSPRLAGERQEALSAREIDRLVAEYVELDGVTETGRERQDEILSRLAGLEPLSEGKALAWKKEVWALWAKGPGLEKKSGRHFLWEDEEKGLYIIGGETKRPQGLFIGMHGGGVGEGDAWTSHGAFNGAASGEDWLAIFPEVLVKTERGWTDSGTEEFVLALVDRALRTWKIDRNKIFLGGHSMGGYGAWTLGGHHADRMAGMIASAGAPTPYLAGGKVVDIAEGVVPNLRNTSIVIYQSDDDAQVPPDANRMAVQKLVEARERWGGFDFEYWEVSGQGHGPPPGGYGALVEKIHDRVRDPRPRKLVWEQSLPWKRQFYWLWDDAPRPNRLIVAEIDREKNEVRVACPADGTGLHVLVDGDLIDGTRELAVFRNDQEVFRGTPARTVAAILSTGANGDRELTFESRIPLAR